MNHNALFIVATVGFEERERNLLRDLLRISEYRTPTFRTLTRDSGLYPQIVIINADRPDALVKWQAYAKANEGKGRLSSVMWNRKPPGQPGPAELADLLTLLERVASEEHGYRPPAAVETEQRPFVLARGEPISAQPSARPASGPTPANTTTSSGTNTDQPADPLASQYIATIVIAPQPRPNPTSEASGTVDGTAEAISAPTVGNAAEIAVLIEPQAAAASMSGSAKIPGSTAASRNATTDIGAPRDSSRARPTSPAQSRFLVVDDSLPVRIQMKEALQRFARTIDFAHDGEQAMILIDNCKYDVIFLDVILPGKDGYDVCRYIRSHALQRQTPVIMLTGNSAPADRVKGKLAGCDTYLIKPVRQSVLTEVISEFIKSPVLAAEHRSEDYTGAQVHARQESSGLR
jgi:CheY-like chemotaxis protein